MFGCITKIAGIKYMEGKRVSEATDYKIPIGTSFTGNIRVNNRKQVVLSDINNATTIQVEVKGKKIFGTSKVRDKVMCIPLCHVLGECDTDVPPVKMCEKDTLFCGADSLSIDYLDKVSDADVYVSTDSSVYAIIMLDSEDE